MIVLALCGRRRCGKDTTVEIIQSCVTNFQRLGFADALKEMYAKEFKVPLSELYDPVKKEIHRPGLQSFQAVVKAKEGQRVFADIVVNKIKKAPRSSMFVVSDMRYLFENDATQEVEAVPYRVHSDEEYRIARGYVPSDVDNHESETEMGDLPESFFTPFGGGLLINNYFTVSQYEPVVRGMLSKILCAT